MKVLKVTKSGCLSHVGRRTASLRTSCAVPGSVGGAEKADCVALRRPAACGVSKNRRERSPADAESWHGCSTLRMAHSEPIEPSDLTGNFLRQAVFPF